MLSFAIASTVILASSAVNAQDWGGPGFPQPPTPAERPQPLFSPSTEEQFPWQESDLTSQSRAPCPMLNTLANHGMLPRDGKNLSAAVIADALKTHLNLQWDFWWVVAQTSIDTVVSSGAATMDLSDLKMHNGIQHDAALTRNDMGFGEHYTQKNLTLVKQLVALNNSGYLSYNEMAIARHLREQQSSQWNPNYTLPGRFELDIRKNKWFLSIDQAAVPLLVLSDPIPGQEKQNGKVPADRMEFFLANERLPFSMGWAPSSFELTKGMVFEGIGKVTSSYLWNSFKKIVSPIGLTAGPDPNPEQLI